MISTETLSPKWGLILLQGIISVIFGLLLLFATQTTITAVVIFIGAYWLAMGIIAIIGIFVGYSRAHWGWALFSGIVGILAGILVLGHPLLAAVFLPAVLVYILAIMGIVMGIIAIVQGAAGAGWGAIVIGILNILLGILLFLAPLMMAFAIIIMIGIFLLIGGIIAIVNAFQIRKASR